MTSPLFLALGLNLLSSESLFASMRRLSLISARRKAWASTGDVKEGRATLESGVLPWIKISKQAMQASVFYGATAWWCASLRVLRARLLRVAESITKIGGILPFKLCQT